ncbi:flagellar basal body rod protein [Ectobacillus ponti]|uniref:Flagellar basal body rod protein n=1 Tax=Ectobacillus ponti TaxID=2961894 RepID=A0AA41X4Q7_9BACI|nr:flagellar basal body rod protein [Ectobacillus ponti]MCP8968677.1 flagellar basal body rod protein [Ectobacillus ponti]
MKKLLTFAAAAVLAIIAFASLGHIAGLLIGAALAYWSFRSFLRSRSLPGKLWWGIAGLAGVSVVLGNFPAVIGIGALALLYYGWKDYRKRKEPAAQPFDNFEREWEALMKK